MLTEEEEAKYIGKKIKKVRCEFIATPAMYPDRICIVNEDGFGSCGDAIQWEGELCLWIEEVLEVEE